MAYLNKEQYAYRRESAAERNISNMDKAMSAGMDEEQAEQIYELCSMRHDFHCNICRIAKDSECELNIVDRLAELLESIIDNFGGIRTDDLCKAISLIEDTDYMNLIEEYADDVPDHDNKETYASWYDRNLHAAMDNLERANTCIERFLRLVDKAYGTKFCPTGALRV